MSKKLIFVVGTTATGKSRLSVQLAQTFGTEIISADSMQVYKHLDISTAKLDERSRKGIVHHLLSIIPPNRDFSVNSFYIMATEIMERLYSEKKTPLITGGTFYYCESLIFENYLSLKQPSNDNDVSQRKKLNFNKTDNYKKLTEIDPIMAEKLHPNSTRKVADCLSYFDFNGFPKGAKKLKTKSDLKVLFIWLFCEENELRKRIDERVEQMLKKGLFEEIFNIRKVLEIGKKYQNKSEHNICQAIGYKQFEDFFSCAEEKLKNFKDLSFKSLCEALGLQKSALMNVEKLDEIIGEIKNIKRNKNNLYLLAKNGIDRIKNETLRYSKKQLKWIKKRFLTMKGVEVHKIDTSDVANWNETVFCPSKSIIEKFLKSE